MPTSQIGKIIQIGFVDKLHIAQFMNMQIRQDMKFHAGIQPDFVNLKVDAESITNTPAGCFVIRSGKHGEMIGRAAREMPILLGDIIVTGSSTNCAIEFLLGGRTGINPGAVVGIGAARTVTPLSPQSFRWFTNKYSWTARRGNLSEPLEIQTNGGTMGGKD